MSVTKRDLPEIHVRRETKYGIDPNAGGINYNNVPEEYLLSLSDDSGKLMHGVAFCTLVSFRKTRLERFPFSESLSDFQESFRIVPLCTGSNNRRHVIFRLLLA